MARHLAMAARLIEEDPQLAHRHAVSAARRAGRIAVVRETLAITAYSIGDFALALRELRTYRRISGRDDQLPMMVDSERGLGRPDKALELARSVPRESLDVPVRVELAIAMSGARLDLGQVDAALIELQIPELDPDTAFSYSPALFDAYATVLEELGRTDEADEWWERSDRATAALMSDEDRKRTPNRRRSKLPRRFFSRKDTRRPARRPVRRPHRRRLTCRSPRSTESICSSPTWTGSSTAVRSPFRTPWKASIGPPARRRRLHHQQRVPHQCIRGGTPDQPRPDGRRRRGRHLAAGRGAVPCRPRGRRVHGASGRRRRAFATNCTKPDSPPPTPLAITRPRSSKDLRLNSAGSSWPKRPSRCRATGAQLPWVATNTDWTLPTERGLAPGNGTLVSAVHTAVGRLPVLAGKPEAAIFHEAVSRFGGVKPLFIGDRLDTDILGANRAGIESVLVLTGVDQAKQLLAAAGDSRPTFLLDDLRQLHEPYPATASSTDPATGDQLFTVRDAIIRKAGNVITVAQSGSRSIDLLRAGCTAIWDSGQPIYALDVPAELYV